MSPLQRDWTPFQELVFDVTVLPREDAGRGSAASAPLDLFVAINDVNHSYEPEDRFNLVQRLGVGQHEIRIPVTDILVAPESRMMNSGRICLVRLFTRKLEEPRTIYLDNVRLE